MTQGEQDSEVQAFTEELEKSAPELVSRFHEIVMSRQGPSYHEKKEKPVILIATPEITYLSENMGNLSNFIYTGDGGGLRDISATVVDELQRQGVNVHVVLPNYEKIFKNGHVTDEMFRIRQGALQSVGKVHTIDHFLFDNAHHVYQYEDPDFKGKTKVLMANALMVGIDRVLRKLTTNNDTVLVHCNDWMTGLVPAIAKKKRVYSLMTFHNIFTCHETPHNLKQQGIDVTCLKDHLYFRTHPDDMTEEDNLINNGVDYLLSGLLASDWINTVSPTFLQEIIEDRFAEYGFIPHDLRDVVKQRYEEGRASGILNAPMHSRNPGDDRFLVKNYDTHSVIQGKRENKLAFQKKMGLTVDEDAALFFWPSRLDETQKGIKLLTDAIDDVMVTYPHVQVAIVANGPKHVRDLLKEHSKTYEGRVSYDIFDEETSQMGKAGADFILMPSLYEPCGLPQLEGPFYGTLPIVFKTGGLADTVKHLSQNGLVGNGFVFNDHIASGLMYGIDEAMSFYGKPVSFRESVLKRVMKQNAQQFGPEVCAKNYIDVYETIIGQQIR